MAHSDFVDPSQDFFFQEWDHDRCKVPIIARFVGAQIRDAWWSLTDVRVCLEAYCSFYASVSQIVGTRAHISRLSLGLTDDRGTLLYESGHITDHCIRVKDSYTHFDAQRGAYVQYDSVRDRQTLFNLLVVRIDSLDN